MPPRNVVPKPVQKPHPPLWVACTNRETMRLAARLGMGALTFAFMDPGEAKFWVEEYYEIFKRECRPIGRTVNPNVAMLMGLMCHEDRNTALTRGLEGQQFFAFGLAYYFRHGKHIPGRSSLWEEFKKQPPGSMAGVDGLGTPDEVREAFEGFEESGVDQMILLQQAANYEHAHICESLELFGEKVIGGFLERDKVRIEKKNAELAPYIEKALERIPPIDDGADLPVVDSYERLWEEEGVDTGGVTSKRSVGSAAMWKLHVGATGRPNRPPSSES